MTTSLVEAKVSEEVLKVGKPVVAIVGRQNVGKSTLLNRVVGKQIAIVTDLAGTTRDRILAGVSWRERDFVLVDTGGVDFTPREIIQENIILQTNLAIEEADAGQPTTGDPHLRGSKV